MKRPRVRTIPLLGPCVLALLVWMVVPLAMTLWFSVERYNLLSMGKAVFAGLENYRYLLTGRALWVAMAVKASTGTLCVIKLSSGEGSCRLTPKKLKVRTYQVLATYGGSTNFKGSTSAKETLTVAT